MSSAYYRSPHWRTLRRACLLRDGFSCTVPGCGREGRVADHIEARPPSAQPTAADRLDNLRTLCLSHDAQVKEQRRGQSYSRKQGGSFKLRGSDAEGWPLDPARR